MLKINKVDILSKQGTKKDGSEFSYFEYNLNISDVRAFRVVLPQGATLEQLPDEVSARFEARSYETKFGTKKELYLRVLPKDYTF